MIKPISQTSWMMLILCLCLGSLVILPIIAGIGSDMPGISEIDFENSDPIEFDDDFLVLQIANVATITLISSEQRASYLDFQSAFLAPDSPPPKHA